MNKQTKSQLVKMLRNGKIKEFNEYVNWLYFNHLSGVDLSRAYLSGADLSGADFSDTNLLWANFSGADLSGAKYSILNMFTQNFNKLSDRLTLELMRHDAEFCGEKEMEIWANGGKCPYIKMKRDFKFQEKEELWKPGKPKLRGLKLWKALAKDKNIKI